MSAGASSAVQRLAAARVVIVGLGLMGASLGYDLRGHCARVVGVVRRSETAAEAVAAGCVDEATLDGAAAVAAADLVVLATPVRTILRQIAEWGPLLRPEAVLLDLGSTKTAICRAMAALPPHVQAIGGHPMCGKETAGLAAAEPGLYRGCLFILCPTPRTTPAAQTLAETLIAHIGARLLVLDPERHDLLVAAISHLPYLAACGVVAQAEQVAAVDPRVWEVAAGGFRDTTRVAASDVTMLLDILLTNREAVLAALARYRTEMERLTALLMTEDETGLRAYLETVAATRRAWNRRHG